MEDGHVRAPPTPTPQDKGAALAILTTGAGGAALLGPLTVTAFFPLARKIIGPTRSMSISIGDVEA